MLRFGTIHFALLFASAISRRFNAGLHRFHRFFGVFQFILRNKSGFLGKSKTFLHIFRIIAVGLAFFFAFTAAGKLRSFFQSFGDFFRFFQFVLRNQIVFFGKRQTFVNMGVVIAICLALFLALTAARTFTHLNKRLGAFCFFFGN